MKELDIYQLTYDRKMSSKADVIEFAHEVLIQEGFDPTIVNIKEDDVSIESFKKFAQALYIAGYKDGLEQNANLIQTRKRAMVTGKLMDRQKRVAQDIQDRKIY